jgi:glycosyltransferase domain-containing protein
MLIYNMSNILPLVSIGVPTRNRAKKLEKCLISILQQSYSNIEVIVSDNMSTDATPGVCKEFMRRDHRVKTYRQTKNIRAVPNFDYVRQKATGVYFMLLGDDDWIDPTLIQTCIDFLEDNPDHIAASGQTHYYRDNNVQFKGVTLSIQSSSNIKRVLNTISKVIDGGTFYAMYRAKPTNKIPYLNVWGMDYYFLCEAAFLGKIKTLADVACHRIDNSHRHSIKDTLESAVLVDRQKIELVDEQVLDPYGTIASILFWRITANGDVFKQLPDHDRLKLAVASVQIVKERWPITGEANLLNIATELFSEQNLLAEFRILRTNVMTEWLNAFELEINSQWDFMRQVLATFIQLGFSLPDANTEERNLLSKIINTSGRINNPLFKNDVALIYSLFT